MIYFPLTHQIHNMNHTQTRKVAVISNAHNIDNNIINTLETNESNTFRNLNAGIYKININGKTYVFNLYYTLMIIDYLRIESVDKAYCSHNMKRYPIKLYELIGYVDTNKSFEYELNKTINSYVDVLIIDGITTVSGTPSIGNPAEIVSISTVKFNTSNEDESKKEELKIYLKNNIKSLPNGVKDLFVLDSDLQNHHIIHRIGRTLFSGNEDWKLLENLSNSRFSVFFCPNDNARLENTSNNINCSHFPCVNGSTLINQSTGYDCISTGYGEYGNGFLVKISTNYVEQDVDKFKVWLNERFLSDKPIVVEYALENYRYKTILLDEYHIKTFYPFTKLSVSGDHNISYFYKCL